MWCFITNYRIELVEVKFHSKKIMKKLGATNTVHALAIRVFKGILPPLAESYSLSVLFRYAKPSFRVAVFEYKLG